AVYGGRLLADDEEARRLVVRAVPVRNADGIGDARLRRRAREGDRADAIHSPDHELGRQFRIAGHIPSDTRIGLARTCDQGLVAGGAAGDPEWTGSRNDAGPRRHRPHLALAVSGFLRLR